MYDINDKTIRVYRVRYNNNSFSRKLYVSPNFKLCLVTEGCADWQIGSKCLNVKQDDIVILSNQHKRVFKEIFPEKGIEMLVVEFGPQLFTTRFQGILLNSEEKYDVRISGHPEMKRLFLELEQETKEQLYHYRLIQKAKLVEILSLAGRVLQISDLDDVKITGEMYRVIVWINENYTTGISLKEAADLFHMSESSLSKHFLKCMGTGFAQYIMLRRISDAIGLLQSTGKTVLEIALECGYHNTASFYKAFKKMTNMTPTDYRNRNEKYL